MAKPNMTQTIRRARNVINALADNVAWKMPLQRTTRDAVAILNPSLARQKKYTPTRSRAQYRMAEDVVGFNPVKSYKTKRRDALIGALGAGAVTGIAANNYRANKKEQERMARLTAEQKAQQKAQQQAQDDMFNRKDNLVYRQQWQDKAFNDYQLKNPVKRGTAIASALQDVQQKIKNKIYPDKGKYVTNGGAIDNVSNKLKLLETDPQNPNFVYDFNNMMRNIPDDSTDVYEMVTTMGAGKPVARMVASTKRPKITMPNITPEQFSASKPNENMSLEDLQNVANAFNSMVGLTAQGNRFQTLSFEKPINSQAPNRGSSTAKRMTKKKTINKYTQQPKRMSNISQRYPEYVRLPKAPAQETLGQKYKARFNRVLSFIESLHPDHLNQTIENHLMPKKRDAKLRNDLNRIREKNASQYKQILQGYYDAKNKGYIK